jgi:hypothetical protein
VPVFFAGFFMVLFASAGLWSGAREDAAARAEYGELHERFENVVARYVPTAVRHDEGAVTHEQADLPSPGQSGLLYQPQGQHQPCLAHEPDWRADMSHFLYLNPDFVGWISIFGTAVSYPIVQAADNAVYLGTTFGGQRNPSGAIFMDYRASAAFDGPLAIIYGHNMRDGSMFSALAAFLDPVFLYGHSELMIVTAAGEVLTYQIFCARLTSAWDAVYTLDANDFAAVAGHFDSAPEGASRFLVLSTCESGRDVNARILVYAALIS